EEPGPPKKCQTDLSLLLECLKFQMKCPDLQKQALLTIHSICEKREHNVELLREMGGVAFLLNLSKSSIVRSDVAETSLFTLSTLAEANVYCKSSLSRKEIFTDLADWLVTEDAPLTKKRVIVYFLSVVVSNNKLGQILAQNTGCLDILLSLFRYSLHSSQLHQLWSSVSSALCGCVNNPQNEEGQRACVTVFPTVKNWFQQISLPQTELFQPICSFIAMTVTNNCMYLQKCFAAAGGLENLTLALIRFCLQSETSLLACQLAVSTSKTLSACISDNTSLASDLAKYGLVFHLFSLLINPKLESEERLSVLLTVGHCTERNTKSSWCKLAAFP
uniref:Telomere repeat binding bouquet formation protein 1 n=1 Tax=Periophthalmus magnuspinnatus TaxID=409849 RepID=A0A3B4AGN0_9GOBI